MIKFDDVSFVCVGFGSVPVDPLYLVKLIAGNPYQITDCSPSTRDGAWVEQVGDGRTEQK